MTHLLSCDPSSHLGRAFSQYPSLSSSSSSEVNRSIGLFTLKCCSDNTGSINGNGKRVFLKEKTKGFFACHQRPPFLADLEKGSSVIDDGCDATLVNVEHRSPGGSHNKPFCFPDHQFPQKLVVAVDVDEGMCLLCMYAYAIPLILHTRYLLISLTTLALFEFRSLTCN